MTVLANELIHRFGEKNVREVNVAEGEMPLLRIDLNILNNSYSVLMTNGLSDIFMPVPEPEKGREYNELYFCLRY